MGEYAEMMLDGTCCEGCGAFLDGGGDGSPGYCSEQCARDRGADWAIEASNADEPRASHSRKPFKCGVCKRRFREPAHLAQHCRDTGHG